MHIFATGMKKWGNRGFIDLMAGPGRCRLDSGEEFDGSPLLSLDAEFTHRVFVEANPELVAALRARLRGTGTIIEGDCNAPETVAAIRRTVPANSLSLAFADNLGTDVTFATLAALTAGRKIDLMIVFQAQDFTRNINDALTGSDDASRVDAFFGADDWRAVATEARARNATPGEVTTELLKFYGSRLQTLGYGHITGARRSMKNSKNATQYRLLLAGKHQKAEEFFRKIDAIEPFGQRGLL
jgi:three-Cys-motif partner protein